MGRRMNQEQLDKVRDGSGFIAALDQSGGSTPKALDLYGMGEGAYSNEEEMFDLVHEMRTRIMTSPSFDGDRILGAILFEDTMNREIKGRGSVDYLWSVKRVVPFLKVDKGLVPEVNGTQVMRAIPDLAPLVGVAKDEGVFGTKMRSVIRMADETGISAVTDQQFEIGLQILASGLMPILEPEIDIESPQKAEAEALLKQALLARLDQVPAARFVMLKLTLPEEPNFYQELVEHPRVLKVVALSGGYTRDEANTRLAANRGVVASFSRALTEGLTVEQSNEKFDTALNASVEAIYRASVG